MNISELRVLYPHILLGQQTLDSHQPEGEVEIGESVLGVIEDPVARSLYSLMKRLDDYEEDYVASNGIEGDRALSALPEAKRGEHVGVLAQVFALRQAVTASFTGKVFELFPRLTFPGLKQGLRKGWQLVVWKSEDSSCSSIRHVLVGLAHEPNSGSLSDADGGKK